MKKNNQESIHILKIMKMAVITAENKDLPLNERQSAEKALPFLLKYLAKNWEKRSGIYGPL